MFDYIGTYLQPYRFVFILQKTNYKTIYKMIFNINQTLIMKYNNAI